MAAPYRKTKKQRKRKARTRGKSRKRTLRRGTTPSLNKVLGPLK